MTMIEQAICILIAAEQSDGIGYTQYDEDGIGVVCFSRIIERIQMDWPEEAERSNSEKEWKWVASAALAVLRAASITAMSRRTVCCQHRAQASGDDHGRASHPHPYGSGRVGRHWLHAT
jgi:hypothetical protein